MIGGIQSAFEPHGPEARSILETTWVLFGGGALIFVAVLVLAGLAVFAPRPWLGSKALIIGGGIVFPLVTLTALLIYTLLNAPRGALPAATDLTLVVTGRQWWWQVDYLDADGRVAFTTANEVHVPIGQTVEVRLRSDDVLHSFWVPALAGKLDLIPGKDNRLTFIADRPGVFRGQCAEYCGGPHAQMAFLVVAEEPQRFASWMAAQKQPAGASGNSAGRDLFAVNCAACHTVRGTAARGTLGPDLTHFGSRSTLGAAILPNRPADVAAWIANNQRHKPGNLMPEFRMFTGDELNTLAAYLESLD